MDSGKTRSERDQQIAAIRRGFFGNADEIQAAESALAVLLSDLDQAEAALQRYAARYGEAVADPLTELRLRLQRGE